MENGYIKLHRKFIKWYGFSSSKRVHLWLTLLLKANHKENKFLFNGQPITVKRGSFVTGSRVLAQETRISHSYIHKLLKEFESEGMLKQQPSNKSRLITILYYNKYQDNETQKEHRANTESTQKEPNKNVKNDKNEKKVPMVFDYFLLKTQKNYKLTKDKRELIQSRLKDYAVEDIKYAIDRFVEDEWEGRSKHMDLVYCIGKQKSKPDNMEKWINKEPKKKSVRIVI